MTQADKELLFQDLCARLPYRITCSIYRIDDWNVGWRDEKLSGYFYDGTSYEFYFGKSPISIDNDISKIKPYLRPMSSMTEEERKEYNEYLFYGAPIGLMSNTETAYELIDWLNAHHFDYRNLIEKGLAIEITEENTPYKD